MANETNNAKGETMNAIETLKMIAAEQAAQLSKIRNMNLTQWLALAVELDVAKNDREHAAKKLALRKLRAEGKLA